MDTLRNYRSNKDYHNYKSLRNSYAQFIKNKNKKLKKKCTKN